MVSIVCIASGASLTQDDVDYCKGKATVFVCNNGYLIAPFADLLYAADGDFWDYHKDGIAGFKGRKVSCDFAAAKKYGLEYFPVKRDLTWGDKNVLASGYNSGFQILNLAAMHKPERILLLGYDMKITDKKTHWFGDHPAPLKRASPYDKFIKAFKDAAPLIRIPVINVTRETALECFPRAELRGAL